MKKGLYTHFITMFVLHGLFLFGPWQMIQSEMVEKIVIPKLGNGMLRMKVSSGLFLASPSVKKNSTVKKPVVTHRPAPVNIPSPKVEPVSSPQVSASSQSTGAAVEGTGGNPNGHTFGTGNGSGKFTVVDLYKAELRATIDKNKYYPTLSRRLGQTGVVVIAFTLLEDGNIVNVRIDKPSQYERLNVSALDAVKKVERFKPIPKEVGDNRMDIKVPVKFVTI